MKTIDTLLYEKPGVGIAGAATGTIMPFIDTVTKFAQCGAAVCGFLLAAYTLYLRIKKGGKSKPNR